VPARHSWFVSKRVRSPSPRRCRMTDLDDGQTNIRRLKCGRMRRETRPRNRARRVANWFSARADCELGVSLSRLNPAGSAGCVRAVRPPVIASTGRDWLMKGPGPLVCAAVVALGAHHGPWNSIIPVPGDFKSASNCGYAWLSMRQPDRLFNRSVACWLKHASIPRAAEASALGLTRNVSTRSRGFPEAGGPDVAGAGGGSASDSPSRSTF